MKIKFSVAIEEEIVKEVDRIAEKYDLSRSQLIQNMISLSLSDVKFLEKVGLLGMVDMAKRVQFKLQAGMSVKKTP